MKMEGRLIVLLAAITGLFWADVGGMELAPLSFIPDELISYFKPWSLHESDVFPGKVFRQRRGTTDDTVAKPNMSEAQLTVYKKIEDSAGPIEELCMMATTDVDFAFDFETIYQETLERRYKMPRKPDVVNGTCALETETARMHIYWPGFNFTLVFTKNPEGNSYYLNKAVVIYDRGSPALKNDFRDAKWKKKVHLETLSGMNYYFVPLGQSYFCIKAEDQGPLDLYNRDMNQIEGSFNFSNTRFQPFVHRAKGEWGRKVRCLPKEIRDFRANMPFISGGLVLIFSLATVGVYAIKRSYFSPKKVDYDFYGEEVKEGHHEMGNVINTEPQQVVMPQENVYPDEPPEPSVPVQETSVQEKPPQPTANPFRAQEANNPFRSGYGAT